MATLSKPTIDMSWLYGEVNVEEPGIKLPEGGGFVSSMVARWDVGIIYSTYIGEEKGIDLDQLEIPYDAKNTIPGTGTFYYWKLENYDNGKKAQTAVGSRYAPGLTWRWECDLSSVKGWNGDKSAEEVFVNGLTFDVPVRGLAPGNNRHELHMIALPSLVQAYAVLMGVIPEPVFNYEELVRANNALEDERPGETEKAHKWNTDWQEFAEKWIGGDKEKDFEGSELWKARTDIWAALGEQDPGAYTLNQNGNHDIASGNLALLTGALRSEHTSLWLKTSRINNMHASAVNKKGKRRQTYLILEAYKNEADAETATVRDGDASQTGTPMPTAWHGSSPDVLVEFLKDYLTKAKVINKPAAVVKAALNKNGFEETASMTVDEAMVWIAEHGLAK